MDNETMIFNALDKEVSTKAFGNHFNFKPRQIKRMSGDIGQFLSREKGYMGLVELPMTFEDPEYKASEEGQALLEEKRKEGVSRRINHLKGIVNNLQVSLRQDLDIANIKADVNAFASSGEINAMEELVSYQRAAEDQDKAKLEKVRQLERQLKANSNSLVNKGN